MVLFFLKRYKYWVLAVFCNIIFFTAMPYFNEKRIAERIKTSENGIYSIATITDYRTETRSNYYKYTFNYNNKSYKSNIGVKKGLEVGRKYFLIINPEKPKSYNFLLYRYPVPDSITSAPPEGWKEPPIPVDKEEIRKFLENY